MLQLITLLLKIHDLFLIQFTYTSFNLLVRSLAELLVKVFGEGSNHPMMLYLGFHKRCRRDIHGRVTSLCSTRCYKIRMRSSCLQMLVAWFPSKKKKRFFEFVDRFFRCWLHLLLGHINGYTLALWGLPFMDVLIVFLGSFPSIVFLIPQEIHHNEPLRLGHDEHVEWKI